MSFLFIININKLNKITLIAKKVFVGICKALFTFPLIPYPKTCNIYLLNLKLLRIN